MSEISKQALKVDNSTSFPNNNTGYISPAILRAFNVNMIDSLVEQESYNADSASWNSQITALESFTGSQQPTFNSLNAFTASQAIVNTNLNAFTQSANNSINLINVQTASFIAWTGSINQIQSNGVTLGTATRFNLVGPGTFFSASLVQNVGGTIATLTFTSDSAKVNTSSFNDYTQSTNATLSSLSSSIGSNSSSIAYLSSKTGSYVTTGSNDFYGNQTIVSGSLRAEGSNILGNDENVDRQIFYGQTEVSGNFYVSGSINLATNGGDGHAFSGKALFLTNSVQTGITVESPIHFYQVGKGNFYLQNNVSGVGSGSINIIAANNAPLNISASAVNVNKGDINIPSNNIIVGQNPTTVYNGLGLINGPGNYALVNYGTTSAVFNLGAVDANSFAYSTEILATATPTQITLQDFSFGSYQYETWLTLAANDGSNPKPFFNRGIRTSGSVEITGSTHGNVVPVTVASSTASIDLSKGNFFTLTLSDAVTTNINITNPQPGTTALLKITNTGIPSASFSNNVKQQRYQSYIPTSGSNTIDLLSIQSFDSNTVFVTKATNFV